MFNYECVPSATACNETNVICQMPFWAKYDQNQAFYIISILIIYRIFVENRNIAR